MTNQRPGLDWLVSQAWSVCKLVWIIALAVLGVIVLVVAVLLASGLVVG